MNFKGIPKIIKKYSREIEVISTSNTLNKKMGRFNDFFTKKVKKSALFFKTEKYILDEGRGRIEADVKIYSFEAFVVDDKINTNSDKIKYKNKTYEIVSCIERDEATPTIYISHGVRLDDRDE